MLHVHYWPTPNGKKITIFLEEAGLEYRIVPCNIGRGDQFQPSYLALNPNHRMPVLVDDAPIDGGPPIAIFESGAILLYLAEKSGQFWAKDLRGRYEITQWVVWQAANQGPKTGELGHFLRLGDKQGDQSYALRRFGDEERDRTRIGRAPFARGRSNRGCTRSCPGGQVGASAAALAFR